MTVKEAIKKHEGYISLGNANASNYIWIEHTDTINLDDIDSYTRNVSVERIELAKNIIDTKERTIPRTKEYLDILSKVEKVKGVSSYSELYLFVKKTIEKNEKILKEAHTKIEKATERIKETTEWLNEYIHIGDREVAEVYNRVTEPMGVTILYYGPAWETGDLWDLKDMEKRKKKGKNNEKSHA